MADSIPSSGLTPGSARSLKFKPKKVDRRSELERSVAAQQIEQEQQEQARAAASAKPAPPPWQRRDRPPYRKVEQQTRQGGDPGSSAAAATSSASAASLQRQPALSTPSAPAAAGESEAIVVASGSSAPAGSSAPRSTKQATKAGPSRAKVKKEKPEEAEKPFVVYDYDDSDEDGVRVRNKRHTAARDVDHLDSASDSDVEFANSQGPPLRPISLVRHEHVDRVKNLNTEATSAASARLRQRQQGQRQHEAGVKADPERTNGGDVDMHDASSSSPVEEVVDAASLLVPHETDEDRAEANRLRADRLAVLDELGPSAPPGTRDRHIYMFQFPPLLPNLIPPPPSTSSTSVPPPTAPPATTRRGKGKQKASAAPPVPPSAAEENTASSATAPPPPDAAAPPPLPLHLPNRPTTSGHVGTLRVYSDGSAALAWGGLEHEVRAGVSGQLLQHVVLAKGLDERTPEEKKKRKMMEGEENVEGLEEVEDVPKEGTALGRIRKTFVVTPGWAQLLEKAG